MSRPHKEGFDYFSFDVDFFDNRKIRKILKACGPASIAVITRLLCNIYGWKGYYILWDEDLPFDIADKVGMSEGAITEIVSKAVQVNLFDKEQFEKNKILTSPEIQRRYLSMAARREIVIIDDRFRVIEYSNQENDDENEQSKVKERKVKKRVGTNALDFKKFERKKDNCAPAPEFPEVLDLFKVCMKAKWNLDKINIEAQKFYSHYGSMDWEIKGYKIKDWKLKANQWIANEMQPQ